MEALELSILLFERSDVFTHMAMNDTPPLSRYFTLGLDYLLISRAGRFYALRIGEFHRQTYRQMCRMTNQSVSRYTSLLDVLLLTQTT